MNRNQFTSKPADPLEEYLCNLTRRRFFGSMASSLGVGLGLSALSSLASDAGETMITTTDGAKQILNNLPHFAPRARRVIYMHMEGGPSQLDLFDYKPALTDQFDSDLPDSIRNGQRITTMTSGQARFPVAPSMFKFKRYENNQDGVMLSELLPHTGSVARELCFIHSMHTPSINHEPGITFFQTGHEQPGRPCFGSWMSYGLGSESRDLPAFVVMITQGYGNMQALELPDSGAAASFPANIRDASCEPAAMPFCISRIPMASPGRIGDGCWIWHRRSISMNTNGVSIRR